MKKIVDMDKWFDDYYRAIYGVQDRVKFDPCYVHTIKEINLWLDSQPDAEEKHGKWELIEHVIGDYACCTHCNEEYICSCDWSFKDWNRYMKYCPNCGAKMVGEEE